MKGTNIDGDVAIGRNLALGGNVVAQGMAHIKSGLRVDGWLDAENIKAANKGLFQNESELKKEYPKPLAGWFAVVIDDIDKGTGFIYTTVDGTWKKTQEQAMPYEFIMDSVNAFATKNEFEQEKNRVQEIDDELLKRIQGVSDNSNSAKDPFKFLGTFTRVTGGEFLNALNAMHSTVAGVYDGYWRALIGTSPVEIYNFAIYYKDDRWIQVLKSPYRWGDGDFDIINDTRYRTIYRIHENGAWGEWRDTEEELEKSIYDETTRAKDAEQELKDEIGNIVKHVAWNDSSKLNDFTTAGVYEITGERKMSSEYDNLPIENSGSGHTISARLEVLDSSINKTENSDDKCITQKLTLSNRVGGDGNVFVRTGRGRTYDSITWEPWATLQTNINVGQVDSLDDLKENGIYSGVWKQGRINPNYLAFVCIVINDYFIGTAPRRVSQFVYGLSKSDGSVVYQSRVWDDSKDKWGDWEILNQKEISSMISAEIKKVTDGIDPNKIDSLKDIIVWIEEHGDVANILMAIEGLSDGLGQEIEARISADNTTRSMGVLFGGFNKRNTTADEVLIGYKSIDQNYEGVFSIPAATTTSAGVMSATDKKKLDSLSPGGGGGNYTLPIATADALGGIKSATSRPIGSDVSDGRKCDVYVDGNSGLAHVVVAPASNSSYGVVKVDNSVDSESTNPVSGKAVADAIANISGGGGGDITATPTEEVINGIEPTLVSTALRKTPQVLTDAEKEIARGNIGSVGFSDLNNAIANAITNTLNTAV